MYVERPQLEVALRRGLEDTRHTVIFGESGAGKSWLYKRILSDENKYYWLPVNLANAARHNSIVNAIQASVADPSRAHKTGYNESKDAQIGIPLAAAAKISHEGHYEYEQTDQLLASFRTMRKAAEKRLCMIVLDNLEAIHDDQLRMKELADIILLCDDSLYSKYEIKILIVGVGAQLREYYTKMQPYLSVTTRLQELKEVKGFTANQTSDLVKRGLVDELGIALSLKSLKHVQEHVHYVTLGMPIYVHEYCLELAIQCEENDNKCSPALMIPATDRRWLHSSLNQVYGAVEGLMNSKATKVGRKNQLLYVLGRITDISFDAPKLDAILRTEFPKLCSGRHNLNVGSLLGEIEASPSKPIKKIGKANQFVFTDPKFRMCLRTMLHKSDDERIVKLEVDTVASK